MPMDPELSRLFTSKNFEAALAYAKEKQITEMIPYLEYRCVGLFGMGLNDPNEDIWLGRRKISRQEADQLVTQWKEGIIKAAVKAGRKGGLLKKVSTALEENITLSLEDLKEKFPEAGASTLEAYRKKFLKSKGITEPRKKSGITETVRRSGGITQGTVVANWLDGKDLLNIEEDLQKAFPHIPKTSLITYASQARKRAGISLPRGRKKEVDIT